MSDTKKSTVTFTFIKELFVEREDNNPAIVKLHAKTGAFLQVKSLIPGKIILLHESALSKVKKGKAYAVSGFLRETQGQTFGVLVPNVVLSLSS